MNSQFPRRVRYRGFAVPYQVLDCACFDEPYMNFVSEPGAGSGYKFPDHNSDCQQVRFQELYKEVYRFLLACGTLYLFDTVDIDRWGAWCKRVKDRDGRFGSELAVWLNTGAERAVLTPFPPMTPPSRWTGTQSSTWRRPPPPTGRTCRGHGSLAGLGA